MNTFGRSTRVAQRSCSSPHPALVRCWTSEKALGKGATFDPKGAKVPTGRASRREKANCKVPLAMEHGKRVRVRGEDGEVVQMGIVSKGRVAGCAPGGSHGTAVCF